MDAKYDLLLKLRGMLAEKEVIDDEVFYIPAKLDIDFTGREAKKADITVNGPGDLKDSIEALRNKSGKLHGRIALGDLAVVSVPGGKSGASGSLNNKVAMVTGAAGAIGYGICSRLLREGCLVAITDITQAKLDEFAGEFGKDYSDQFITVRMDVTDEQSVLNGYEQVVRKWGGIDILIINAGIALVSSLVDMKIEDFRRLEKVNIDGTLLTIAEAARYFIAQNIGGDIVLVSTKNVFSPSANFGAYSATKAGSHQLARIASLELAQHGVRVNMVAPDGVFSGGTHKSGLWQEVGPDRMKARGLDEKGLEEYYKNRNLLKTKVTARHVANAVMFFVTRQTPSTGATIPVDGGLPDATPR